MSRNQTTLSATISGSPSTKVTQRQVDMKTIEQLEQALREETIANEEQRSYIQILKNIIEQKMEHDGILEVLNLCRQDRLRSGTTSNSFSERDYETFGKKDNVETYIGLLDFSKRIKQQNQVVD